MFKGIQFGYKYKLLPCRRFLLIPFTKDIGNQIILQFGPASRTIYTTRKLYTNAEIYDFVSTPSDQIKETFIHAKCCQIKLHFSSTLWIPRPTKGPNPLGETVKCEKPPSDEKKNIKKKSIWEKVKEEAKHYYHASILLKLNVKVSSSLLFNKVLKGHKLTRREKKLLSRTVGDMFKVIPLLAFVFVPFLEFTLPFFLILFPTMLPSPYETKGQKEHRLKRKFNVQVEMAKFLQNTLQSMDRSDMKPGIPQEMMEFTGLFEKIRNLGEDVTMEDLMQFCKLFRDEITLNNLPRPQVVALCKLLGIKAIGTTSYLRYLLELKMRNLKVDDKLIHAEEITSLNRVELESACQARGIPAVGQTEEKMRKDLSQWLRLSVEEDIPPSLLLLSQALLFPSNIPTKEKLAAAIQELPEQVITAAKADIQSVCGKMDYKAECDCIKNEVQMIHEERQECSSTGTKERQNENEIECALCSMLSRKMRLQKENLAILKNKLKEYEKGENESKETITSKETKGAKRLRNQLENMLKNMTGTLSKLEKANDNEEECSCSAYLEVKECEEILGGMTNVCESTKEKLLKICHRLERSENGQVTVESLMKTIDIIEHLEATLSTKQVDEIIDLIDKEGLIESDFHLLKSMKGSNDLSDLKKKWKTGRQT